MQLKLKSYNGFLLKIIIPALIFTVLIAIIYSFYFAFYPEDLSDKGELAIYISSIILSVVLFSISLLLKYYNGVNYIFEADCIQVYEGKKFVEKIDIDSIETIIYHPFRFRYIITVYGGELMDGGAWKLHIKFKDGTKKSLCYFSLKNVKQIKEIYGDLINIV